MTVVARNKAAGGRHGTEQEFKPHILIHKYQAEKDNWEWQGCLFENFKANPVTHLCQQGRTS